MQFPTKPIYISHRGAPLVYPENTFAGIEAAIQHGARYIEFDVRQTADGELILMHDRSVERLTNGIGLIEDLTWAEMSPLRIGEYPVARLDEVLTLAVENPAVVLVIEVKEPHLYPHITANFTKALAKADIDSQTLVICFDHDWLKELPVHLAKGILINRALPLPAIIGVQVVDCRWSAVLRNPFFIRRVHQQGLKLWVWTVDQRWLQWLLIRLGVDGITTNTLIQK